MRWDKGSIKYTYKPKKQNNLSNYEISCLPPIPYIQQPSTKIALQKWYYRYYKHVDEITDSFLEVFYNFVEANPWYNVQFDEQRFRETMLYTLYNTSYNTDKQYV